MPKGPQGPEGPQGPPGKDGVCIDLPRDSIFNVAESQVVKCDTNDILVQNGFDTVNGKQIPRMYRLSFSDGELGQTFFLQSKPKLAPKENPTDPDSYQSGVIQLGYIRSITYSVIDIMTGEAKIKTGIVCEDNSIKLIDRENEYQMDLTGAAENFVLMNKAGKLTFSSLASIGYHTTDNAGVKEVKTSVTCTIDTITFQDGDAVYDLDLKSGEVDMPLLLNDNKLIFANVKKLGYTIEEYDPSNPGTPKKTEKTSITCTEDSIILKDETATYSLDLADGENGALLTVKGNKLVFVDPKDVEIDDVLITSNNQPDLETIKNNTLIFIYDDRDPYIPA